MNGRSDTVPFPVLDNQVGSSVQHQDVNRSLSLQFDGEALFVFLQVYRDVTTSPTLYLTQPITGGVRNVKFCPYEDVLGVGHAGGFSSLLIPGYLLTYLLSVSSLNSSLQFVAMA